MAFSIFLDTNILYHILHYTPKTDQVLTPLEEDPGTIPQHHLLDVGEPIQSSLQRHALGTL